MPCCHLILDTFSCCSGCHASSLPRTSLPLLWKTMCDHQGLDIPSKCWVLMSAIQVSASVSPVSSYEILAGASSLLKANDSYLCLGARVPWDSTPLALRQVCLSANEQSKQRRSMKGGVRVSQNFLECSQFIWAPGWSSGH